MKKQVELKLESVELSLTRCGYEECNAGYSFSPHKKNYYVLYAVTEGECICEINGQSYRVEKNSMIMIFPEWECSFRSANQERWSYAWFGFAGMKAEECAIYSGFSNRKPIQNIDNAQALQRFVEDMIDIKETTFANVLKRNGLLQIFFSELIDYYNKQILEEQLWQGDDVEKMPHIKNAIAYINENYSSKIKINELADYVGVNRSYLASSFKKATGYSPKEYLLSLRMEKAKSLLEKTDMPINAVAHSVGYSDQLAFSRMFKEYAGISPKAFREGVQK